MSEHRGHGTEMGCFLTRIEGAGGGDRVMSPDFRGGFWVESSTTQT